MNIKQIFSVTSIVAISLASTTALAGGTPVQDTPTAVTPVSSQNLADAVMGGKAYIDVRYRFENVDQDGIAKDANASTIRTKLGYTTGKFYNLQAKIELENSTDLGGDNYNDTLNGKNLPVVADPDSTEVNHAYLDSTHIPDTLIRVGRQPVNLDNQRFVGTVGWRQNDQSYDAAVAINSSLADTTLIYGYVDNVNRIFSDDHPFGNLGTTTHLINASYSGLDFAKIVGYGYIWDLDDAAVSTLSAKTFGLRLTGDYKINDDVKALYTAEYALQSDTGDNPNSYDADYYNLKAGVAAHGFTAELGYEVLGSDNGGTVSFQTPLATGHAHNGWADKFLSTPAGGLEDFSASLGYKFSNVGELIDGTKAKIVYHDYSAETGGGDYGTEWNALLSQTFEKHYTVSLKYADYQADTFATDTQKFWFTVGLKF